MKFNELKRMRIGEPFHSSDAVYCQWTGQIDPKVILKTYMGRWPYTQALRIQCMLPLLSWGDVTRLQSFHLCVAPPSSRTEYLW